MRKIIGIVVFGLVLTTMLSANAAETNILDSEKINISSIARDKDIGSFEEEIDVLKVTCISCQDIGSAKETDKLNVTCMTCQDIDNANEETDKLNMTCMTYQDIYGAKEDAKNSKVIYTDDETPTTPFVSGPVDGFIGKQYEYKIVSYDPNGDDVYYKIFWGDMAVIYWSGPYKSGEEVTFSHSWDSFYFPHGAAITISVTAKDSSDHYSPAGQLSINMQPERNKIFNQFIWFFEYIISQFPWIHSLPGF